MQPQSMHPDPSIARSIFAVLAEGLVRQGGLKTLAEFGINGSFTGEEALQKGPVYQVELPAKALIQLDAQSLRCSH
jgi:hypothetical protein